MRTSLAIGSFALMAALGAVGCSKESKEVKACKAGCSIAVETVCGGSGKEYANECVAKCEGETTINYGSCPRAK